MYSTRPARHKTAVMMYSMPRHPSVVSLLDHQSSSSYPLSSSSSASVSALSCCSHSSCCSATAAAVSTTSGRGGARHCTSSLSSLGSTCGSQAKNHSSHLPSSTPAKCNYTPCSAVSNTSGSQAKHYTSNSASFKYNFTSSSSVSSSSSSNASGQAVRCQSATGLCCSLGSSSSSSSCRSGQHCSAAAALCHCVSTAFSMPDLNSNCSLHEQVTGWEGSVIIIVAHSNQELRSGSEPLLSGGNRVTASSSHKPPYLHKGTSIGRSDSKSSLKFRNFQDIPYQFAHYCPDSGGDLSSVYISKYRDLYTYPAMKQRLQSRSTSRLIGVNPAAVVHRPLVLANPQTGLIKPKLIVLGEGNHNKVPVYNYAKKLQAGSRHSISKHHSDFLSACLQPSKGRYTRLDSASSPPASSIQTRHSSSAPTFSSTRDKSDSFPRDKACLKPVAEPGLYKELSMIREKPLAVQDSRCCSHYPSRDVALCESCCIDSDISVKWTSKSFPSFKVSSPNSSGSIGKSDSFQKSNTAPKPNPDKRHVHTQLVYDGNHKQQQLINSFNTSGASSTTASKLHTLPDLELGMPLRCPPSPEIKSGVGQLLRSKPLAFHNSPKPELCYEALCLQGRYAGEKQSPSPIAIAGP